MLADEGVRGVIVATPAPTHHAVAMAALRAGKDVLVEKPLALSSAEARELCLEAERLGRILMVGHLLLYHPAVQMLRDMVKSGELGEVLYVYCQRLNLGVVRSDENVWWSLAPHDLSLANYLLDAEPSRSAPRAARSSRRDAASRTSCSRRCTIRTVASPTCTRAGSIRTRRVSSPSSARRRWPSSTTPRRTRS